MKIPFALLKKWIFLEKTELEIADSLTQAGLEVDSVDNNILNISLTPNLGHAMSVLGVARELSALFNQPLLPFPATPFRTNKESFAALVMDPISCPRYTARVLENLKIAPSPPWLLAELVLLGIHPINNVVDVTNYVMQMIGQPLHAFNLSSITSKIIVRYAQKGESLILLDDRTLDLDEEMLVIADEKGPLALAGIMGGKISGVTSLTTSILLESAYFCPRQIRKTSKKTAIVTESSKRFERGLDPNLCLIALDYAASLIQSVAGGTASSFVTDCFEEPFPAKTFVVRIARINKIMGVSLASGEISSIYERLGFTVCEVNDTTLQVQVPTRRVDITSEIDLVKEVARIYGFNNIPRGKVPFRLSSIGQSPFYTLTQEIREQALCLGLQELLTCDLLSPSECGHSKNLIKVINSNSQEQSVLRPSLLPGLLKCLRYNIAHQELALCGFEIGRVHYQVDNNLVEEEKLGIILHGDKDFYDIKGLVFNILSKFGEPVFIESDLTDFHPFQQLQASVNKEVIAFIGQIHPKITDNLAIFFAEINISLLATLGLKKIIYKPLSLYPSTTRDLTITLKEATTLNDVLNCLKTLSSDVLEKVSVVNIYRHQSLGDSLKNMSLRFLFRSPYKTLSFEEAEKEFARFKRALEQLYVTNN
ncbi:MAG: phenylalanine--tRNA ligase subunit beta [Chlamydiae bacterium]|nr:phenylalanine--tRNA ligase subunit beta [Chlamydiota bacterium]